MIFLSIISHLDSPFKKRLQAARNWAAIHCPGSLIHEALKGQVYGSAHAHYLNHFFSNLLLILSVNNPTHMAQRSQSVFQSRSVFESNLK